MNRLREFRHPFIVSAFLIAACLAGHGCGGDGDGGTGPQPEDGIGPEGGTVSATGGGATVVVPAGALATTVDITVAAAASPPAGLIPGTGFDFGPGGTVFALPVTLTLDYDPADVAAGTAAAQLRLVEWAAGHWIPLADSAVDSVVHILTGTTMHFSTYGVAAATEAASETAVLTDSPSAANEFDDFVTAIAWLDGMLDFEDLGILVWRTSTPQEVETLSFAFDLRIDVDAGADPVLQRSSGGALTINATGAIDLAEFEIFAPGGFVLNANRNLSISNCDLPDDATLNIGGVKGAPFPAGDPGYMAKSAAAAKRAKGATIFANSAATLNVNVNDSPSSGTFTVKDNQSTFLNVGGTGVFRGTSFPDVCMTPAPAAPIPVPYPNIALAVDDNAQARVANFKSAELLKYKITAKGQNLIKTEGNEAGTMQGIIDGDGSPTLEIKSSKGTSKTFFLLAPTVTVEVDGLEATTVKAYGHETTKAATDVTFTCEGLDVSELFELDFTANAGAQIDVSLTEPTLGEVHIFAPNSAELTLAVAGGSIDGLFYVGPNEARAGTAKNTGKGSVTVNELAWSGNGTDHVDFSELDSPVSVTNSSFSYDGSPSLMLGLTEIGGSINVTDNTLTNMGIGLVDCTGAATIQNNTVTASTGYGISLGGSAATTIQGCILNCGGGGSAIQCGMMNGSVNITQCTIVGGAAALVVTESNVTCDNNEEVTGMITISSGQLHFAGNTCSGVQLVDDLVGSPGLQNDPVADNDGLLPDLVYTHKDFDGNGCCEYPTIWNETDEHGACIYCAARGKSVPWR